MSRPTTPVFNPPANNADNFGRRTRETFLQLNDVVDFRDEMNTYQLGTKLIPNIFNSFEIPGGAERKRDEPFVYDGTNLTYDEMLYSDRGLVLETKAGYTNGGSSVSTNFMYDNDLTLDNTQGYRSINLLTETLQYPIVNATLEMNLYFAIRVPTTAGFAVHIVDDTEISGVRISQIGANQTVFSNAFTGSTVFSNTIGSSAGGGIYFFHINIPVRPTSGSRPMNVSYQKFGLDDYTTAFAPDNNYNLPNPITEALSGTSNVSNNRRLVRFVGTTTGTRLFHAKLEVGNPRNGL